MSKALTYEDLKYLMSVVRMDIRAKLRSISKFRPRPGQPADEAEAARLQIESSLSRRRAVYNRLQAIQRESR